METPCHEKKPFVDAEKSISLNENSDVQEQNSTTSLFEPNEKSTPKPMNVVKDEEKLRQTSIKIEKKKKNPEATPDRTVSITMLVQSKTFNTVEMFMFSFSAKTI